MFTQKKLEDKELEEFLLTQDNKSLRILADILVYNKDNQPRKSQSLNTNRKYKLYYPNELTKLVPELIHELQLYGGDSFANFTRCHGVTYREILCDTCKKFDIKVRKTYSIERIELILIQDLLEQMLEKADEATLFGIIGDLGIEIQLDSDITELCEVIRSAFSAPQFMMQIIKNIIQTMCPQITNIMDDIETEGTEETKIDINAIGTNAALNMAVIAAIRSGGVIVSQLALKLVPLINVASTAWLVKSITAPNESVTFPALLYIILLKMQFKLQNND